MTNNTVSTQDLHFQNYCRCGIHQSVFYFTILEIARFFTNIMPSYILCQLISFMMSKEMLCSLKLKIILLDNIFSALKNFPINYLQNLKM